MVKKYLALISGNELPLILFFILVFILVRSIHFPERLDFSTDQATSSAAVLEMVRNHDPVLIGPRFTLEYKARYMFFGPLPYYFQTPFMVMGGFDPIPSSYLFMLFASLMLMPLYFGTKYLINKKAALLFCTGYSLLPFFVNYSGFLWNPNFQFILLPVLVWLMGRFKKFSTNLNFFWVSLVLGMLLEFHFIFIFIILGFVIFYFCVIKVGWKKLILFILGLVLGMSPLILFDLRNDFYETKTVLIFIRHWREVLPSPGSVSSGDPHYFLPFAFFAVLLIIYFLRRYISYTLVIGCFGILVVWCLVLYLPTPTHGYGMVADWSYLDEEKAHQIIKAKNVKNFNVVNLGYDTIAEVQKYLLKEDNIVINYYDYWYNDYLYIISDRQEFLNDPAYEVKNINPGQVIQKWDINDRYKLYLVEKIK